MIAARIQRLTLKINSPHSNSLIKSFWTPKSQYSKFVREALKKRWKFGPGSKLTWPPLPSLDSLTGIFFIVHLALIGHEIYFEKNLYFSLTKVVWHLKFFFLSSLYTVTVKWERWKFPSVRPTSPKNGKMFYRFQGIQSIFFNFFEKPVKRLEKVS